MKRPTLAMDRRTVDTFGKMHVTQSNISKACVNPYYGREIPNWEALGLDPNRVYMLLRDPIELRAAASTFNLLPILDHHVPVTAEQPSRDVWIGTTGDRAEFAEPFLRNSLSLWTAKAVKDVADRVKYELSCAYSYVADMTAGVFEGTRYDGIMRNIKGNHVALVKAGRAGRDVVVGDSKLLEKPKMSGKKLSATQKLLKVALMAYLPQVIAQDAEIGDLDAVVGSVTTLKTAKSKKAFTDKLTKAYGENLAQDAEIDVADILEVIAADEEPEAVAPAPAPVATPADVPAPVAAAPPAPEGISKVAMDAAIAEAERNTVARMQAISAAEKECRPILGDIIAQDSAEAVYTLACDAAGVEYEGVTGAPALRALVLNELKHRNAVKVVPTKIAQDSAINAEDAFHKMFPTAKKGA